MSRDLEACLDCALLVGSGAVYDGNGWEISGEVAARIRGHLGIPRVLAVLVLDDADVWFSWRACDTCGSDLGGDRYAMTATDGAL